MSSLLMKLLPYFGLLIVIAFSIFVFRGKKIRSLKEEKKQSDQQLENTEKDRDEIIQLHNDQQQIKEEADAQKKELDESEDSSLVDRANSLFE